MIRSGRRRRFAPVCHCFGDPWVTVTNTGDSSAPGCVEDLATVREGEHEPLSTDGHLRLSCQCAIQDVTHGQVTRRVETKSAIGAMVSCSFSR